MTCIFYMMIPTEVGEGYEQQIIHNVELTRVPLVGETVIVGQDEYIVQGIATIAIEDKVLIRVRKA